MIRRTMALLVVAAIATLSIAAPLHAQSCSGSNNSLTCTSGASVIPNANTSFPFTASVNASSCGGGWVGVGCNATTTNSTNRHITIGSTVSQQSGNRTEYLIADTHFGNAAPTNGCIEATSGTPGWGRARVLGTTTLSVPAYGQFSWDWVTSVARIFEFYVPVTRSYTIQVGQVSPNGVNEAAALKWCLHLPASDASWRPRSSRFVQKDVDQSYSGVLTTGWHCVVVFNDAFHVDGPHGFFSVDIDEDPSPLVGTPQVTPSTVSACGGATSVLVSAPGIVPWTQVVVSGTVVPVTPGYGSVVVPIAASLTTTPGSTIQIDLNNPAPGQNSAWAFVSVVAQPLPMVTGTSPVNGVAVGATSVTLIGANFLPSATVRINNQTRTSTYVNSTHIAVALTSSDTAHHGYLLAQITDPCSGTSNVVQIPINAPTPTIQSPSPSVIIEGSPQTTLNVPGTGFETDSVVLIDGNSVPTTYVGPTLLTATLDADLLDIARMLEVRVQTPTPGGGLSNPRFVTIRLPFPGTETNHLSLATGINGLPTTGPGNSQKTASAGDVLVLEVSSPTGGCVGERVWLFASLVDPGTFAPPYAQYPNIHVMGPYPTDDLLGAGFLGAPAVLPSAPILTAYFLPPGFGNLAVMVQAIAASPLGSIITGIVASDAHRITLQ